MYNCQLKTKFIKAYTDSIHSAAFIENAFEQAEPYEEKFSRDIYAMDASELQETIDHISGIKHKSYSTLIVYLKEYVKWCLKENVLGATENIFQITEPGVAKLKEQTVANPMHLQKYLNEIFYPESEQMIDNLYRCWFWMAYMGVREEDVVDVTIDQVDISQGILKVGGKTYSLYGESIPAFSNAASLTSFRYSHPHYSRIIIRDRLPGNLLMRGIKANSTETGLRAVISKSIAEAYKCGKTDRRLSYSRVALSGLFYRTYEMERAGFPVSFSEAVAEKMRGKTYSYNHKETESIKKKRFEKEFLVDYNRWKSAFTV